jgi:hypothetical protein
METGAASQNTLTPLGPSLVSQSPSGGPPALLRRKFKILWVVVFYALVLIVGSGLGLLTGNWRYFPLVGWSGLALVVAWWMISKLRAFRP